MLLDRNWIKPAFAIIALNNDTIEQDKSILKATGLHFKQVEGVYKGESETNYLITFAHVEDLATIAGVAKNYSQESILVVDQERNAQLVYLDGRINDKVQLGKFTNVSEGEAKLALSYTFDRPRGNYYLAK